MYSKQEAAKIRRDFWVSYAKSFPRKWTLYNTKIKDFGFKFVADRKKAEVTLNIETSNQEQRELLYAQVLTLKKIIETEFLAEIIFEKNHVLENGKTISKIYVPLPAKFSIHNKDTWKTCYQFYNTTMHQFELFWEEYQDYINQAVL